MSQEVQIKRIEPGVSFRDGFAKSWNPLATKQRPSKYTPEQQHDIGIETIELRKTNANAVAIQSEKYKMSPSMIYKWAIAANGGKKLTGPKSCQGRASKYTPAEWRKIIKEVKRAREHGGARAAYEKSKEYGLTSAQVGRRDYQLRNDKSK